MRNFLFALLFVSTASFAQAQLDQFGLTGTWYNSAASGQGFMFEVFPDIHGSGNGVIFGGWFTYDSQTGQPIWYSLQGNVDDDPVATLTIYNSQNGFFAAPPGPSVYTVGTATVTFFNCTHGELKYTFDTSGESGTIVLTRLTPNLTCSDTGAPQFYPSASTFWDSGSWYDKNASGQGLLFDIDPTDGNLFAGWFTYANDSHRSDSSANQRWYSLQIAKAPQYNVALTDIPIYATNGGLFNAPSNITQAQVGTASLTVKGCSDMTLDYTFTGGENSGLTGTIDLVRPGPAPFDCNFSVP
jgi:hypothetical protein